MNGRVLLCFALACGLFLVLPSQPTAHAQDATDESGGQGEDASDADGAETPEAGDDDPADDAPAEGDADDEGGDAAEASNEESNAATASEEAAVALPGHTIRYQPEADPPETSRFILPPFFHEHRGDRRTTVLFPLYARQSDAHDAQMLIGPYFQRRGATLRADVLFPIFWSFRGANSVTWIVPPVYSRVRTEGFDFGIAPLVFAGRSNESVYTIVPPLLTVAWANEDHAHTFAGPFWRIRDHENEDWGIFPVLWTSQHETFSRVVSPLYLRFRSEEQHSDLTIFPLPLPVYHRTSETSTAFGVAPLFFHSHDATSSSITIPPLVFHYSHSDEGATRLVTPLFGFYDDNDTNTVITPLYQRHRGVTQLDAVAPLFFSTRDEREHSSDIVIPPLLFWHHESPQGTSTASPLFVHVGETGRYDTLVTPLFGHYQSHERNRGGTWILPTFEISHTEKSQTFNIHPLLYETQATTHRHFVLAPIIWNFENDRTDSAATVIAPLFWRFRSHDTVSQLALNTYWHESRTGGVRSWEFHFFPLFAFGETAPGDTWWNVLYGLVGYKRQGDYARMQLLYIPFQVAGPAAAEPAAAAPVQSASGEFGSRFN